MELAEKRIFLSCALAGADAKTASRNKITGVDLLISISLAVVDATKALRQKQSRLQRAENQEQSAEPEEPARLFRFALSALRLALAQFALGALLLRGS